MYSHLQTLGRYHQWAYGILFAAIDQLAESDYFADVGLAFFSVHGTLNHLYLGDHVWYCRFNNQPHHFKQVSDSSFDTYTDVKQGLQQQAEQWITFMDNLPATLPNTITATSFNGIDNTAPYLPTLLHVFNHATHHRGQISAALTQKNIAAPEMDLCYYLKSLQ